MSKGKIRRKDKKAHRGRGAAPRGLLKGHRLGDCYELAFNLAVKMGKGDEEVYLAHGIPTLRDPETLESKGVRYGHAWVEFGEFVFDPVVQMLVPKFEYYCEGQIDEAEVVRYHSEEARSIVLDQKTWGPWDERFFADDIVYANDKGAGQ